MRPFGWRDAFVVAFFVVQFGALAPWLAAGRGPADGLLGQVAYLVFYLVAATLMFVRVVRRGRFGRPSWAFAWPAAYLALATVSLVWSDVPWLTFRRAVALAGAMTFAMWLASVWDVRRLYRAVAWALAVIAAASWVAVVAAPGFAIHGAASAHVGDWRGVLLHKNLLGREMALGAALAAVFGFASRSGVRWGWWTLSLAMGLLVVGSGSATGAAVALALAGVVAFTQVPARGAWERVGRWAAGILIASGALATVVVAAPALLAALGRDTTFTGRDRIWAATLDRVAQAPLGAGYGAFWEGPQGAAVSRALGYPVVHAHNGWLEVAAQLGWPGVFLVVVLVLAVATTALRSPAAMADPARAGTLVLVAYVLVVNVPDAVIAGPNSPTLILLVTVLLRMAYGARPDVAP